MAFKAFHEAQIIERMDGSLWILSRIDLGMYGGMEESVSYDGGKTWTEYEASLPDPLKTPGSRFHIQRLKSGSVSLITHDTVARRLGLSAFLSDDDGITWTKPFVFDEREVISYPDACESEDGRIWVIYDCNRTTDAEILMVSMTEQQIRCQEKENIVRYTISRSM